MMEIEEILRRSDEEAVKVLRTKRVKVPSWEELRKEYDVRLHPVMDRGAYPDVVDDAGRVEKVTRVVYDYQRLATARMSELVCGVPVKRVYSPKNATEEELAGYLESVFERNRIDSVNVERTRMLFAGCEVFTLWYAVAQPNRLYGFDSPVKVRCRNFSPMLGHALYPLFDESGDLVAMSIGSRTDDGVECLDTYTDSRHVQWRLGKGKEWSRVVDEGHSVGKIAGVYAYRPSPIWENTSGLVYEMEWAMSRSGNYLRRNSKPIFYIASSDSIDYGREGDENSEFRTILQVSPEARLGYATWEQAIDNLKYHVSELRQLFFTTLQIPDWSYESIKSTPMSGEARKQLFIDCHLKVKDESGRLLEMFDREVSVVKAFLRTILPEAVRGDLEALSVESVITPYTMDDERDTLSNIALAVNNRLMSRKEGIQMLGWSKDVDKTYGEIMEEAEEDVTSHAF